MIVTFCAESSYDNLFSSVEQQSEEGTKVLVYKCSHLYLANFIRMFEGNPFNENDKKIYSYIQ